MSEQALDKAAQIRAGEELNVEALTRYLQQQLPHKPQSIEVKQFPSGYSNLTYLIQAGQHEYVLRRPPFGANIKSAHDMGREYRVLAALKPTYGKVPTPVLYEADETVLGAPFYMMERVKGIILRNKPPKGLDLTPELMQRISEATVDNMVALHTLDLEANGLAGMGKPDGYIQRQVEGWTQRYQKAETDTVENMNKVANWLLQNMPADNTAAFIHNDYKYDNLVLNAQEPWNITAVLDWEMATVGHPLMDLGTTLGYWAEPADHDALKPFNLTWMPGNLTRQQVAQRYAERTGTPMDDLVFYFAFGAFKIGVIVQQIYARFKKGLTKDPRFAALIFVVHACANNAAQAIELNRISDLHSKS